MCIVLNILIISSTFPFTVVFRISYCYFCDYCPTKNGWRSSYICECSTNILYDKIQDFYHAIPWYQYFNKNAKNLTCRICSDSSIKMFIDKNHCLAISWLEDLHLYSIVNSFDELWPRFRESIMQIKLRKWSLLWKHSDRTYNSFLLRKCKTQVQGLIWWKCTHFSLQSVDGTEVSRIRFMIYNGFPRPCHHDFFWLLLHSRIRI